MATETDIAWFAGFYEGEGWICNDKSNSNKFRIGIAQNDPAPLEEGMEVWGGFIRERNRVTAKGKECHGYEWIMNYKQAIEFLEDTEPYMRIPRKLAQIEKARKVAAAGSTRRYKCNFCEKDYANPAGRRRHERNEHIAHGERFECEQCDRKYKSIDELNRHVRTNHNDSEVESETIRKQMKKLTAEEQDSALVLHDGRVVVDDIEWD